MVPHRKHLALGTRHSLFLCGFCVSAVTFFAIHDVWAFKRFTSDSACGIIADRAKEVIELLQKKDIPRLCKYIHPELHLAFSPYGFIGKSNRKFDAHKLDSLWKSKQRLFWGRYDGTGKPIRLTMREYFERFVYDRDYQKVSRVAYNTVQRSDMFVNIFDVYPQAIVADHLFLATPEFEEMDWRALRLVFSEYQGKWYLVHIVHDEWTM